MMDYTASVSIEILQKNGETVYSDFDVEVNGKKYKEDDEMEELIEELYDGMARIHKRWKKKRI